MENYKEKLKEFIYRNKKKATVSTISLKADKKPIPWFKRPLEENEFSCLKGKDNKWYVRHKEWSKHTFIGPYGNKNDADEIVKSYVNVSLEGKILGNQFSSNIHSLTIENVNEFFNKP